MNKCLISRDKTIVELFLLWAGWLGRACLVWLVDWVDICDVVHEALQGVYDLFKVNND